MIATIGSSYNIGSGNVYPYVFGRLQSNTLLQVGLVITSYSIHYTKLYEISGEDWDYLEKGLKQRIYALNMFIDDIYNDQKILKDKVIPKVV